MRLLISLLFLYFHSLAAAVDFDVVVVGTSPISLLEALYHHHLGSRVLILEESSLCGGAWKSINICGIPHVDLGCHTLGQDKQMLQFLEEYVGCTMVSMDNPHQPFEIGKCPKGYYPATGCYEIIHNLLRLIEATNIVLLLDTPLESVFMDGTESLAIIKTRDMQLTTSKVVITPYSHFKIENLLSAGNQAKSKFYHLYLLIEDPTPPRFSFRGSIASGVSRLMNLSHFVGLEGTGLQLLVFQTHNDSYLHFGETYLNTLKKLGLLDASAHILKAETYIYEQSHYNSFPNSKSTIFEILNTRHIQSMTTYIPKWKKVLKPFQLAIDLKN